MSSLQVANHKCRMDIEFEYQHPTHDAPMIEWELFLEEFKLFFFSRGSWRTRYENGPRTMFQFRSRNPTSIVTFPMWAYGKKNPVSTTRIVRRGEIEHHIKLTQKYHTRVRKNPRLELALLEKSPCSADTRIKRAVPEVLGTLDGGLDLCHDFKVRKH